jgi:YggT family protein
MDVNTIVTGLDTVVLVARYVLLGAAGLTGLVCAGDWLVRTRRLSPFGAPARFFRATVDPAIAPVERAVLRYGGVPSAAPLWALLAVVVFGILLLSGLDALRDGIIAMFRAASLGPRGILWIINDWTFWILEVAIGVRVISSWLGVKAYSRWVRWSFTLTEWLVRPLRRRLPPLGMFDISPIVAYVVLLIAHWLVQQLISI